MLLLFGFCSVQLLNLCGGLVVVSTALGLYLCSFVSKNCAALFHPKPGSRNEDICYAKPCVRQSLPNALQCHALPYAHNIISMQSVWLNIFTRSLISTRYVPVVTTFIIYLLLIQHDKCLKKSPRLISFVA